MDDGIFLMMIWLLSSLMLFCSPGAMFLFVRFVVDIKLYCVVLMVLLV